MAERQPSPQLKRFNVEQLHCYGCAHSASGAEFPGRPSGERPCCSCIRNPERETLAKDTKTELDLETLKDNKGNPRDFNPFAGTLYNGAPTVYFPMDNYVTLDQRDQEAWFEKHPDYAKPISFHDNVPTIIEREV